MKEKNSLYNLKEKVILVTGASGLIGKTVSLGFLDLGAKVILADINPMLENDNDLKPFSPGNYLIQPLDITNSDSINTCVNAAVSKFGNIDVLVNNAGLDAKYDTANTDKVNQSRFENYPIELLRKSLDINVIGTIQMTQAVCRQMLKQKQGNIINVASTYSLVAPNQNLYDFGTGTQQFKPVDYIVTKSSIPNFTRYLATFYAKDNIRSNTIVPHAIENNHSEAFKNNFSKLSPLGRMCERDELVGPFSFLASDASSYMTGSTLTVDGGWTAW